VKSRAEIAHLGSFTIETGFPSVVVVAAAGAAAGPDDMIIDLTSFPASESATIDSHPSDLISRVLSAAAIRSFVTSKPAS